MAVCLNQASDNTLMLVHLFIYVFLKDEFRAFAYSDTM